MLADRKAKSGPLGCPGVLCLDKGLQDVLQIIRRNAAPGIGYGKRQDPCLGVLVRILFGEIPGDDPENDPALPLDEGDTMLSEDDPFLESDLPLTFLSDNDFNTPEE